MNKLRNFRILPNLKRRAPEKQTLVPIPDAIGYYATSCGEIWSDRRNRLKKLKLSTDSDGYLIFSVFCNGKKSTCKAHRAIAAAFYGKQSGLVAHLDGTRTNNRIENLMYATPQINAGHRGIHGNNCPGEKNGSVKLSLQQIQEIRNLKGRLKQVEIAKLYGIVQPHVSRILRGENWSVA